MSTTLIRAAHTAKRDTEAKLRQIVDRADQAKRPLTAEENATIGRLDREISDLDQSIAAELETQARDADIGAYLSNLGPPVVNGQRGRPHDPATDAFLRGETNSLTIGLQSAFDIRNDVLRTGTGNNVVPSGFRSTLVEAMLQTAVVAGVSTRFTTDGGVGNFIVPAATAHPTATLTAEAAAISESDPTFAQITFGAYKYAVLVQVSSETLVDSGVNLSDYLARRCGEAVGRGLGAHLVTGTGTAQPSGIVTGSTLGETAAGAAAITMDELLDLKYSVGPQYRASASAAWLMADSTALAVRKLKDDNGNYLWQSSTQAGQPDLLLGSPVYVDPTMPALATGNKTVIFGDMAAYGVRFAGGVRFERSDDFAFNTDLVTFRCLVRADGRMLDTTGAIKHLIQA